MLVTTFVTIVTIVTVIFTRLSRVEADTYIRPNKVRLRVFTKTKENTENMKKHLAFITNKKLMVFLCSFWFCYVFEKPA